MVASPDGAACNQENRCQPAHASTAAATMAARQSFRNTRAARALARQSACFENVDWDVVCQSLEEVWFRVASDDVQTRHKTSVGVGRYRAFLQMSGSGQRSSVLMQISPDRLVRIGPTSIKVRSFSMARSHGSRRFQLSSPGKAIACETQKSPSQ